MGGQWQGVGADLSIPAPSPGQAFQPITGALIGIYTAINAAAAGFTARTQSTATAVVAAAAGYANQDSDAAGAVADMQQVRVV